MLGELLSFGQRSSPSNLLSTSSCEVAQSLVFSPVRMYFTLRSPSTPSVLMVIPHRSDGLEVRRTQRVLSRRAGYVEIRVPRWIGGQFD
jgi:hypothetical protein